MDIKARIAARKVLLVYFYEQYFFVEAGKKKTMLDRIEKINKVVSNASEEDHVDLTQMMQDEYYADVDREILYIINHHFPHKRERMDYEYIKAIWWKFSEYKDVVRKKVNEHALTFKYDDMDIMDRVIFILWYIEFVELWTQKNILMNEMIELAKRYGDESSPKLINGIWHKILV